mgnify:CR=1 FL=1
MLRARWTKLSLRNAPCARSSHKLSAIAGKAYLFGGEAIARNSIDSTLHVCTDDGDSWKWQALLPELAPPARVGHAQAVLGSKLYVFGGRAGVEMGESELGDLWAFDADGGSWEELRAPNVPSARSFHAATSANGRLYVFGGCGADGRMADLHAYDAAANNFTFGRGGFQGARGGPGARVGAARPLQERRVAAVRGGAGGAECDVLIDTELPGDVVELSLIHI